jgi:hypothetical protein
MYVFIYISLYTHTISSEDWEIEPHVLEKIQPILNLETKKPKLSLGFTH